MPSSSPATARSALVVLLVTCPTLPVVADPGPLDVLTRGSGSF